ncbi:glycosyltransferase [Fluoribacter gormanii]|uniref:glycosyltransferase n=1 Tax=Fluoribacter gormanii TaxID=464 RepID=UPI002242E39C|nr:glycosyltransferase [Fluoribacter gormanii]MCW8470719.1 glycosyltransferase [Fluoribacter gormanii]
MRIVLDLQGAQTPNTRFRGIGRYVLSLALAIARNRGEHEIFIALNGQFPESIEPIRAAFDGLLPQEHIRVWYSTASLNDNDWSHQTAELIREAFIAYLKPDIVLIGSFFEGTNGGGVATSIGRLSKIIPVAVLMHDLIPLVYADHYLRDSKVKNWYFKKLESLGQADLLLSNSEHSRQEVLKYLSFPEDKIVNISSAVDDYFKPLKINNAESLKKRYGLTRPFVLYTGGIDFRKNINGLIRAYAKLPLEVRTQHQLVIVCSITRTEKKKLLSLAASRGLAAHELILTGFVPSIDLLGLYNLCKVFVFPSLHEGFGLPVLEAMSCGQAVIGSNKSSIPEVIGREDNLFDPHDDESITKMLFKVLMDDDFRRELQHFSLEQAKLFSWDISAQKAINALVAWDGQRKKQGRTSLEMTKRLRLAYVSPLPPECSGISYYSAELLPSLSRFYEIDVVVAQNEVCDSWITANYPVRSIPWFQEHGIDYYDRVIYHFGNSVFHQHMFELCKQIPGVIMLHDFFLSGIIDHMAFHGTSKNLFNLELYYSHGYKGCLDNSNDHDKALTKYPCNLRILQEAKGVIVHSEYSRYLANYFYGSNTAKDWFVIPLLRKKADSINKLDARRQLGLNPDAFVVCSFGILGPNKENNRLLDAWLNSELACNKNSMLVFVGENHPSSEYGLDLLTTIYVKNLDKGIYITGWCDEQTYRCYLAAADIAVQLRKNSRGETSAAVLDCMNFGLPTIINAHGSLSELPDTCVRKLPEHYTNNQLKESLESLWNDKNSRVQLATSAQEYIRTRHDPYLCAQQYHSSMEYIYEMASTDLSSLSKSIARIPSYVPNLDDLMDLTRDIAQSVPPSIKTPQFFVDISVLINHDVKTGIQRVTRSILKRLLESPPPGYRVEPVYASPTHAYRYARKFSLHLLSCASDGFEDMPIDVREGDILLGLDLSPTLVPIHEEYLRNLHRKGVSIYFIVYDLLPILLPQKFTPEAERAHISWIKSISMFDGALCISKSVADEVSDYLSNLKLSNPHPFKIGYFHLGADIENSLPTMGIHSDEEQVLQQLKADPTFVMVGTIEPRKGHQLVLSAFELLWSQGVRVNLVIVGKEGWEVKKLIKKLREHQELSKKLFWLERVSDEYLEKIYTSSTCMIAASEGEGFGLPLIEAAKYKLPIIARDIKIFREVAGNNATYFNSNNPSCLAEVICFWLEDFKENKHILSKDMPWLTWEQSTRQLLDVLFQGKWYTQLISNQNKLDWRQFLAVNENALEQEEQCN